MKYECEITVKHFRFSLVFKMDIDCTLFYNSECRCHIKKKNLALARIRSLGLWIHRMYIGFRHLFDVKYICRRDENKRCRINVTKWYRNSAYLIYRSNIIWWYLLSISKRHCMQVKSAWFWHHSDVLLYGKYVHKTSPSKLNVNSQSIRRRYDIVMICSTTSSYYFNVI